MKLEKKDIETMIKEKMDLYCKQYGKKIVFCNEISFRCSKFLLGIQQAWNQSR